VRLFSCENISGTVGRFNTAAALLALTAGCNSKIPSDPAAEASCREEGFDPGTTEYADCIEKLSGSDQSGMRPD
jgi:hypothetical protein